VNYILALLFAGCASLLVFAILNIEIESGGKWWWVPVLVTFVGGFALIAIFLIASLVALKGWP